MKRGEGDIKRFHLRVVKERMGGREVIEQEQEKEEEAMA